jgi:hypothetical protein
MKKIRDFTVYKNPEYFSAFPSVALMPSGELLVAFRRAADDRWLLSEGGAPAVVDAVSVDHVHWRSHIAAIRLSSDLSKISAPETLPMDPLAADQDGNLLMLKSGRLLQYGFLWRPVPVAVAEVLKNQANLWFFKAHSGIGTFMGWGSYVRYSDDEGRTWSERSMLPVADDMQKSVWQKRGFHGGAIRGRAQELGDGRIALFSYGGQLEGGSTQVASLYLSEDQGHTWSSSGIFHTLEKGTLQEPALANWPEGKLTVFYRTAGLDDHLVTLTGSPDAATWQAPQEQAVIGHPYDPLVLSDGRLFLVYGYRHRPYGVRARLVEKGEALADAEEFILRDDAIGGDVGYPWAVELTDGKILVVYYFNHADGIRRIEASLIEL